MDKIDQFMWRNSPENRELKPNDVIRLLRAVNIECGLDPLRRNLHVALGYRIRRLRFYEGTLSITWSAELVDGKFRYTAQLDRMCYVKSFEPINSDLYPEFFKAFGIASTELDLPEDIVVIHGGRYFLSEAIPVLKHLIPWKEGELVALRALLEKLKPTKTQQEGEDHERETHESAG